VTERGGSRLEIDRLSTGYGRRRVIDRLSLGPIAAGEVTALVGPNAAGKSTLLRALAGLIPIQGSVRLDGEDLGRLGPAERASRVGFLPQTLPQGVGLTVLESVIAALRATSTAGTGAAEEEALRALEQVGMIERAMDPLDHLSGGQRQLAGLAQSIVRNTDLLLLDEPTSALDLRHQALVMRMVRRLAEQGRIVVAVLHDLSLAARWADAVVVMDGGAVYAAGSPVSSITPRMLADVYGVEARVETCTRGTLQVTVDDVGSAGDRLQGTGDSQQKRTGSGPTGR
jgi:iron complex transport system ATP-binding protein